MPQVLDAHATGNEELLRAEIISRSRERSSQFGLQENDVPDLSKLSNGVLAQHIDKNYMLYKHAMPVMETLHEQIVNTHNMLILTDASGLILHALGDDDFIEKAERVALKPGADWSEKSKGTNAVGTALTEGLPTLVHADQHYLRANHFLTCSCAPIVDPHGAVIGALDVTGDKRSFHKHTMALVKMSTQMIENHLFSDTFPEALCVHFHLRAELIGTLVEGIIAFSSDGRFLSANRSAQFQFGLSSRALKAHTLSSLFGISVSALYDHYRVANPGLLRLCMQNGIQIYARCEIRSPSMVFGPARVFDWGHGRDETQKAKPASPQTAPEPATRSSENRAPLSTLQALNTGDPQVHLVIDKINKVQGRDIPILVLGETGTGKELLAHAIHNESPRKLGPFVAVNCASIPENLIESELFGYGEGAFTGARKKGNIGKMQLANGGTLFLDEIGDMPLNLQARLLRVLQERVVTPLGTNAAIAVNLSIICATNRNLREMIAEGKFREDLYYRLNGLVVRLPPLRDRSDLAVVVEKILAMENFARPTGNTVSPAVMDLFKSYRWPGNLRQLTNVLRTAVAMSGEAGIIDVCHLPDDFLEDISDAQALARVAPAGIRIPGRNSDAVIEADPPVTVAGRLDDLELQVIAQAISRHHGNVSAAARTLGISRNTIYRKMPHLSRVPQESL